MSFHRGMYGLPEVHVRRDHVFEDMFAKFGNSYERIGSGFSVTNHNELGLEEAGIGKGPLKECLTLYVLWGNDGI